MPRNDNIYHVTVNGRESYFGSIAAIYTAHSKQDLGICQKSLYNYKITEDRPYRNAGCTIRVGTLVRKPGGRGFRFEKAQTNKPQQND